MTLASMSAGILVVSAGVPVAAAALIPLEVSPAVEIKAPSEQLVTPDLSQYSYSPPGDPIRPSPQSPATTEETEPTPDAQPTRTPTSTQAPRVEPLPAPRDTSQATDPAPTPTPVTTTPPWVGELQQGSLISYLTNTYTYGWNTSLSSYSKTLENTGATGAALAFPLAGAAYATCLLVECETKKVEVRDLRQITENTFEAKVRWKLHTTQSNAKQTALCKVTSSGKSIVSRSCELVYTTAIGAVSE